MQKCFTIAFTDSFYESVFTYKVNYDRFLGTVKSRVLAHLI